MTNTPWQGLGVKVEGMNVKEILKASKLDWQVGLRSLLMKAPTGDILTLPLTEYRAVVRSSDDFVFQLAGDGYVPIQNEGILNYFSDYCDAGQANLDFVGSLRSGAVIWALAKLKGGDAKLPGNDMLKGYVLLATSHDGSLATIGQPTQVREISSSTLGSALKRVHTFKMRHTRKLDPVNARETLGRAKATIEQMNELALDLARVSIDQKGQLDFVARMSSLDVQDSELTRKQKLILDAIIDAPGSSLTSSRNTLWGCVSGVSYWADHSSQAQDNDNRLYSAWFGDKDKQKVIAVQAALDLAGLPLRKVA